MPNVLTVSAQEAARSVPKLLQAVRQGHWIEITDDGRLIAMMKPFEDEEDTGTISSG